MNKAYVQNNIAASSCRGLPPEKRFLSAQAHELSCLHARRGTCIMMVFSALFYRLLLLVVFFFLFFGDSKVSLGYCLFFNVLFFVFLFCFVFPFCLDFALPSEQYQAEIIPFTGME